MVTVLALVGVLVIGLVLGVLWRGSLLIGDRRALDRLSAGIEAEQRMREATQSAVRAMHAAVREHHVPRGGGR